MLLQVPGPHRGQRYGQSHVGRKIAATLASTGSPAFFMHPWEAAHGDLGMITTRMSGWRCPIREKATNCWRLCQRSAVGDPYRRHDRQRRVDTGRRG